MPSRRFSIPEFFTPTVAASPQQAKSTHRVYPTANYALPGRPAQARVPVSTYRLQFGSEMGFAEARKVASYLHDLGVSDCYASPLLKALPGSTHGYDVCDHNALNPVMGSEAEFEHFSASLRALGMGLLFDFVPNHMGIGSANAAWMDVLENGPGSPYGEFFDIDWHPLLAQEWLENKVLLPVLADPYGKVLENGEIRLLYEDGSFHVQYGNITLPITPRTQTLMLRLRLPQLEAVLGKEDASLQELESIITALNHLPPYTETSGELVAERQREKEVIRRRLSILVNSCRQVSEAIEKTVRAYNGVKGVASSFDLLDKLLDMQAYRLAYWRVAADEINYRRFFDINDLAAIRVEIPAVFCQAHRLVFRLLGEGKITGLRIDHPDGLWDPAGYFRQLQRAYAAELRSRSNGSSEDPTDASDGKAGHQVADRVDVDLTRLYVVAEKILMRGERLPCDWLIHGTTGYDFASSVNGIFVARANERAFDSIYGAFTGQRMSFRNLVNASKKMIMLIALASEVNLLGYQLKRFAAKNRWYRDFTLNGLTFALREVIASLPVYRTYLTPDRLPDRQDRQHIEEAVAEAKRRNPRTAPSIFDFIAEMLLGRPDVETEGDRKARARFVAEFQQTTGPVMAKGVEDTAYYIYNRLCSLNEVGGSPEVFGITVTAFHRQNVERLRAWPHSLLATSTHDTKRGEDVRARINVLSEMPKEWRAALSRWSQTNASKKVVVDGNLAPDPNEEYLLYQTLLGAWPFDPLDGKTRAEFTARLQSYVLKAAKEAKVNTSWINPNTRYDAALQDFVAAVLEDSPANDFLADFSQLQERVARYGVYNSLAQTLLKITAPGVPDIYQGSELWDLSLVDPDNRRAVDFAKRARMLKQLQLHIEETEEELRVFARRLLNHYADGRVKLYVTHRGLAFRRDHDQIFSHGKYVPLRLVGGKRGNACAFARQKGSELALIIVPRLVVGLTGSPDRLPLGSSIWGDTAVLIPCDQSRFINIFTGETVEATRHDGHKALYLRDVLETFPVSLLQPV